MLLFTLRAGRPPFDSQTGDRETDTDMILDGIATATDESILTLLKQQQRSRLVKLQDNEISLLRHMMAVAPEERFTIDEVAAALEGMLHGLSATQKVKSLDRMVSAVRDVGIGMARVGSQIRLGHKQMAKIDSGMQQGNAADMPPPVKWPDWDSWQAEHELGRPPDPGLHRKASGV